MRASIKSMELKAILVAIILGFSATPAMGRTVACDTYGAKVVFKDTLYGAGTGLLLGLLTVAAADCASCSGDVVSGAALAGGLVGTTVGIIEIASRECEATKEVRILKEVAAAPSFRWSVTPVVSSGRGGGALLNTSLRF